MFLVLHFTSADLSLRLLVRDLLMEHFWDWGKNIIVRTLGIIDCQIFFLSPEISFPDIFLSVLISISPKNPGTEIKILTCFDISLLLSREPAHSRFVLDRFHFLPALYFRSPFFAWLLFVPPLGGIKRSILFALKSSQTFELADIFVSLVGRFVASLPAPPPHISRTCC